MDPQADEGDDTSTQGTAPELTRPAEVEAWKARKAYPSTLVAGGPVFGAARERAEGGWELLPDFAGHAPQDARDDLGTRFRVLAQEAGRRGDRAAVADYLAAARRLDGEGVDEVTVGGERYRVVRAERFIRMGPDGPEPPRPTDPDPGGPGEPAARTDPAAGLVVPVAPGPAPGQSVHTAELLAAVDRDASLPYEVADDSRNAMRTHPSGMLLPATFMTAEREGGSWRPDSAGVATTPQAARDGLAMHLRVIAPWQKDLDAEERAAYAQAADRLDAGRRNELDVAGRHFRIVRVERLIRIGPDGPEGPRPSDADQEPFPAPGAADDDPADTDERMSRFFSLFAEERTRRAGPGTSQG
jgi:uncharacterized protein DUF5954